MAEPNGILTEVGGEVLGEPLAIDSQAVDANQAAIQAQVEQRKSTRLGRFLLESKDPIHFDRQGMQWVGLVPPRGSGISLGDTFPIAEAEELLRQGWTLDARPQEKREEEYRTRARAKTSNQSIGDKALAAAKGFSDVATLGYGDDIYRGLAGTLNAVSGEDPGAELEQLSEKGEANPGYRMAGMAAAAIPLAAGVEAVAARGLASVAPAATSSLRPVVAATAQGIKGGISSAAGGFAARYAIANATDTRMLEEGWAGFGLGTAIDFGLGALAGGMSGFKQAFSARGDAVSLADDVSKRLERVKGLRPGADELTKAHQVSSMKHMEEIDRQRASLDNVERGLEQALRKKSSDYNQFREAERSLFEAKLADLGAKIPRSQALAENADLMLREQVEAIVTKPVRVKNPVTGEIDELAPELVESLIKRSASEPEHLEMVLEGIPDKGMKNRIEAAAELYKIRTDVLPGMRDEIATLASMAGPMADRAEYLYKNKALAKKIRRAAKDMSDDFISGSSSSAGYSSHIIHDDVGMLKSIMDGGADRVVALQAAIDEAIKLDMGEGFNVRNIRLLSEDGKSAFIDDIDKIKSELEIASDPASESVIVGNVEKYRSPGGRPQEATRGLHELGDIEKVVDNGVGHNFPDQDPSQGILYRQDPERKVARAIQRSEVANKILDELTSFEAKSSAGKASRAAEIARLEAMAKQLGENVAKSQSEAAAAERAWTNSMYELESVKWMPDQGRPFGKAMELADAADAEAAEKLEFIENFSSRLGLKKPSADEIDAARKVIGEAPERSLEAYAAVKKLTDAMPDSFIFTNRTLRRLANIALSRIGWKVGGLTGRLAVGALQQQIVPSDIGGKLGFAIGSIISAGRRSYPVASAVIKANRQGGFDSAFEKAVASASSALEANEYVKGMSGRVSKSIQRVMDADIALAGGVEKVATARINYLSEVAGRVPTHAMLNGRMIPTKFSRGDKRKWELAVAGSASPQALADEILSGRVNPETVEATKAVFPGTYETMRNIAIQRMIRGDIEDPSVFMQAFDTGMDVAHAMSLQANFLDEDGNHAQPSTATKGDVGSLRASEQPTNTQE